VAELYTVDASVFLNAFNSTERGHEGSAAFFARVRATASPIIVPTLLLPEVAATITLGHGDAALARSFADAIARLPNLVLVPLDRELAEQAANVAAGFHLRGSDAVYVAVALRFNADLVTRDREQRERAAGALTAISPEEAISDPGS
jgi:predicted nucleic acid-binding protein